MIIEKSTIDFLKELASNNNRIWFNANKEKYAKAYNNMLEVSDIVLSGIEKFDRSLVGIKAKDCIFRIYKDTRFSKDKNPFKLNFGAFFKKGIKNEPGSGYYLHIEPNASMIGVGIYMPPSLVLSKIRKAIIENSKELKKILNSKNFKETFGELGGEKLKTAPKGISKDHPEIELLKLKHYVVMKGFSDKEVLGKEFIPDILSDFKAALGFNEWLNRKVI